VLVYERIAPPLAIISKKVISVNAKEVYLFEEK
jgi:hypothetical protein